MSGYYSFNFTDKESNKILCIFKSDSRFIVNELIDVIDKSFKTPIGLDKAIIIVNTIDYAHFHALPNFSKMFDRGEKKIKHVSFVTFDEFGAFMDPTIVRGGCDINYLNGIKSQLIEEGIKNICSKNSVINIAPPGTQFSKLSGKTHTDFIRASSVQGSDSETSFMGFCLLQYWGESKFDYIYIDTMSIAPMIYKLINLKKMLNPKVAIPQVISYRSYKGMDHIRFLNKDRSLIFVSASSSGDMATKLQKRYDINPITILSYVKAPEHTHLLCNISTLRPNNYKKTAGLSTIQIVGEDFRTEVKEPREVVLRAINAPAGLKETMQDLYNKNLFHIKKNTTSGSNKEIYIDGNSLLKIKSFRDWLNYILRFYAPLYVSHIVHTNDETSKKMALSAKNFYKNHLDNLNIPQILSADKLGKKDSLDDVKGILILSAISSSGSQLLSISRDLRNLAKGTSRTFIVGLSLPKNEMEFLNFKSSLIYSPNREKYTIYNYLTIPIGERLGIESPRDSWDLERELLNQDEFEGLLYAEERHTFLNNLSKGYGKECFYHSPKGIHLKLRDDFVFWKPTYDPKKVDASSVYLTIASFLQEARAGKDVSLSDKLYSDNYQRAILSPECFYRFNDGIIQASLLRAANPEELNYSISSSLSTKMKDVLIRFIHAAHLEEGEALLEFLIALATRRLLLKDADVLEVLEEIQKNTTLDEEVQKFSEILVQIASTHKT